MMVAFSTSTPYQLCMTSMPKPRVYIAVPRGLYGRGGIERQCQYIFEHYASSAPENAPELIELTTRGDGKHWQWPFVYIGAVLRFMGALLAANVDLLHLNMSVYASTWRKMGLALLAKLFAVPVVVHVHGGGFDEIYATSDPLTKLATKVLFRCADRILVLGAHWQSFVQKEFNIPSERLQQLLNAVPMPPEQPPRDFNAPILEIVFLGEVGTRKGVDVLIPALAKIADLPNWRMTIAGNGNIERYKAEAAALGIAERVQFTGWLNPQAAQEILQRGHILVLASRQENLPMSVLEAMAYGLVVVSTPVGAVPQVLKDGESGYLVAMGDEDALAAALREALLNPSRSAAMAAKAKRFFAENLTIEAYIPRLVRIYQELIR